MAKDKAGKASSNITAGVLNLTDEELETAEKRKDYIGGGGTLPEVGQHEGKISLLERLGKSETEKTKGAEKFRVEVTLDDGSRLNDFPIAHPSTAGRLLKMLEVLDLKQVRRTANGNELVLPTEAECDAAIGTPVIVEVSGYQDQYRDRELPKEERRQQAVWGFVSAAGGKKTGGKAGKATAASNGNSEKKHAVAR